MAKRLDYIDIAKGIGIILVVVGHLRDNQLCGLAKSIIFSFHMPLFFLIAGFNFNFNKYANSFIAFIKHRFLRLMVPYFAFNIFVIVYLLGSSPDLTVLQKINTVLYGIGNKFWTWELTALWFLPSLFCAEILFYFLVKATNKTNEIQVLVLLILSIIGYETSNLYHNGFMPIWSIDLSLVAILFMYIGWKFRSLNLPEKISNYAADKNIQIFILLILCFIFVIYFNKWPDMNSRRFNNIFEFYIGGIVGSLIIVYISALVLRLKPLKELFILLGKNSLYILIFHLFSARIFYGNLFQEFPGFGLLMDNNPTTCSVLFVLWAILFSLFFAYLVKCFLVAIRYFPIKIRNKGA